MLVLAGAGAGSEGRFLSPGFQPFLLSSYNIRVVCPSVGKDVLQEISMFFLDPSAK